MTDQLVQRANADPHFAVVFTLYRAHTPQIFVDIDRAKVQSLQVPMQDVFTTLQVYMGGLLRQSVQQVRPHLAGQHPGRPRFAHQCRHPQAALCPLLPQPGSGPDGAAGHAPPRRGQHRPRVGHALQHVHFGRGQRRPGARRQLRHRRPGDDPAGARAGRALRVDRDDLPAGPGRQCRLPHLRPGDGAGVLGAGGQVRELAAAAGSHPGRAHVSVGRGHGHDHRPTAGGHLRADRFPGAGRPGLQERHPDRRVRARAAVSRARSCAKRRRGPPAFVSGRSS